MSNQEAIALLRNLEDVLDSYCELNEEGKAAFRMAITALELFGNSEQLPPAQPNLQQSCNQLATDLISRQAAIDAVHKEFDDCIVWDESGMTTANEVEKILDSVPSAQPEQQWIPIKWHYCTDEDREKYGFSNDIVAVFDNEMPDDNQEILITTSHGYVEKDVCYIDEGFSLDSGYDWIDDVKAWMPLPEPYREE